MGRVTHFADDDTIATLERYAKLIAELEPHVDLLKASLRKADRRIDRLEIALHRIAGTVNITAEQAREIAAEAVEKIE